MAVQEDPATVLEQFVHDVANLPAEIAHLMEEMQAKEELIQGHRDLIAQRDGSLQKFIKLNGSLVKNPKEDPYSKQIAEAFVKAQQLQEEKIALSEKAATLLDRQIKRFDLKMRDLQNDGSMPFDPQMPSLLRDSPGNLVERASSTATGANTPLQALSGNTSGGTANIANAAVARMMSAQSRLSSSNLASIQQQAMLNSSHMHQAAAAAAAGRSARESSVGGDAKRRRLNQPGSLPMPSSNLARQSSLGPGTPKTSTPGSRQGSVGPRMPKKTANKKVAPHQMRKKILTSKKKPRHSRGTGGRSGSTTGEDDPSASEMGSDDDQSRMGGDGTNEDEDMDVDEDGDDTKYCTCQRVSFGNMVCCDNDNCKYQWFHWDCVGMVEEPHGDWLCPDCRTLPKSKIKKSQG